MVDSDLGNTMNSVRKPVLLAVCWKRLLSKIHSYLGETHWPHLIMVMGLPPLQSITELLLKSN